MFGPASKCAAKLAPARLLSPAWPRWRGVPRRPARRDPSLPAGARGVPRRPARRDPSLPAGANRLQFW